MNRVGIDLVRVDEVASSIETFGQRYLDRVFTQHEQQVSSGSASVRARSLAARFAAKEAAVKALRLVDGPGDWRAIEVLRHPDGWVELSLTGECAAAARRQGIGELAVSFSHEGNAAVAVVTCTARDQKEQQ